MNRHAEAEKRHVGQKRGVTELALASRGEDWGGVRLRRANRRGGRQAGAGVTLCESFGVTVASAHVTVRVTVVSSSTLLAWHGVVLRKTGGSSVEIPVCGVAVLARNRGQGRREARGAGLQ